MNLPDSVKAILGTEEGKHAKAAVMVASM